MDRKTVLVQPTARNATRERTVVVNVERSEMIQRLDELQNQSSQLQDRIALYRRSGVDTSDLEEEYLQLQELLVFARQARQADNRSQFREAIQSADERAAAIQRQLQILSFRQYVLANWWKWAMGAGGFYVLFFLVTMIGIPYYRVKTRLRKVEEQLETAVEARKKAEEQYFRREIDRSTFMEIMTERQNQILELRGERDELQARMKTLLRDQLSVRNFLMALLRAPREIDRLMQVRREDSDEAEQ
ncbi:MAG: hypothetical protein ABEI97_01225 [Candidatus Nanohaloarchaea archaeon]